MNTIEELLGRKSSSNGLETENIATRHPLFAKVGGSHSVGIVRLLTKTTELIIIPPLVHTSSIAIR
jgi:hypothetical protein